jgi:hypothetical protein
MGANNISNENLKHLNIDILGEKPSGSRKLQIKSENINDYFELISKSLNNGFWNEVVSPTQIIFGFKFKDGSFKKIFLNPKTEKQISELCTEFNNDPIQKTSNVYKYISENELYAPILNKYYFALVNR